MKIIIVLSFLFSTGCVAQKLKIRNAEVFSQPSVTGTLPLVDSTKSDENNRYFAYLEIKNTEEIKIENAWVNGIFCVIDSTEVNDENVTVGETVSNKKIVLTHSSGYKLLRLEFSKAIQQKKVPASFEKKKAGTIIKFIYNKKRVYYYIPTMLKLKTDLSIN